MKRGFTYWELMIVLGVLAWPASIIWIIAQHERELAARSNCQSRLHMMGLAFYQYTQDYDGAFPRTALTTNGTFGWADNLSTYTKSILTFQCPAERHADVGDFPRKVGYTDFWMNQRLSGYNSKKLRTPQTTILSGDGNDGTDAADARYAIDSLPASWIKDENSPSNRHRSGANYVFADGHIKWLGANKIDDPQISLSYTFLPH